LSMRSVPVISASPLFMAVIRSCVIFSLNVMGVVVKAFGLRRVTKAQRLYSTFVLCKRASFFAIVSRDGRTYSHYRSFTEE
jgi:hypothetical protein